MKEWYTIDELVNCHLASLPAERSSISRKATRENWQRRNAKTGKRGVTHEFHIQSFPEATQKELGYSPSITETALASKPVSDIDTSWIDLMSALTTEESELLLKIVKREGVKLLLMLTDIDNIELMSLSHERRAIALRLNRLPEARIREIFDQVVADLGEQSLMQAGDRKASA
ncbi:DNA-binding protein [Serratia sp. CY56810]|uniref:DNA-binding protein n=1 Tax=Serratia sp. CY56810 TaxID=3383642 RepID=UPI003FA018F4